MNNHWDQLQDSCRFPWRWILGTHGGEGMTPHWVQLWMEQSGLAQGKRVPGNNERETYNTF